MVQVSKTNSDVLDYTVQWKNFLSSGEIVNSISIWTRPASQLGITSISNLNSAVVFFIGSGATRSKYTVETGIVTNQGRRAVRSFKLEIIDIKF